MFCFMHLILYFQLQQSDSRRGIGMAHVPPANLKTLFQNCAFLAKCRLHQKDLNTVD